MKKYINFARFLVARHTHHGLDKIQAKKLRKISSVGTERSYRQAVKNYLQWCDDNQIQPDFRGNKTTLTQYLEERREWIQQKTLNQERQALQLIYKQKLPLLKSLQESIYSKRSYLLSEVMQIVLRQNEKNVITTWLAFFCGTRAHEAATILPHSEQAETKRNWNGKRFAGLSNYSLYTVKGKGGLIRKIAVPNWLKNLLEIRRRDPIKVVDREVTYVSCYDIGIGQAWSQSFCDASKKTLGISTGGHGLRHSYAKWRLQCLIDELELRHKPDDLLSPEEEALLVLSQELGHFRLDIVYCYLR
jgi:integrase